MPTHDYKKQHYCDNDYCKQEARLSAIETKLENKKEHLHEVDEDYYHLRDKLDVINLNLTSISTTMDAIKDNRKETDKKIVSLQLELKELKTNWSNLKWIIGLGVPVITTILTIIANYIL